MLHILEELRSAPLVLRKLCSELNILMLLCAPLAEMGAKLF